ncbi:DUF4287 domain-containing protein [Sphingomonas antarctica]|uniref:DUF4287 domain-containing protein n=1 Tax=Sphingomonas antarctica TaxID=2040274 RepID=UPI0039EAD998
MPSDLAHLTERQQKWFASVKASLETRTGKTLDQWVAIAKTCPHDKPNARRDWLKAEHGLLQNSAMFVLHEAFPEADDAGALRDALWRDPEARETLESVRKFSESLGPIVVGQRKSFTAFSRDVQFAAMRPVKGKGALLGLKLDPALSPRLIAPVRAESWSERLTATILLPDAAAFDDEAQDLFRQASLNG